MYIPPHHREEDPATILAFVRTHLFATLVTTGPDGIPNATHLPFLLDEATDGTVRLIGHVAKANRQAADLAGGGTILAIFQGPHAYISPTLYEKPLSVPTWDYVAVHAYGTAQVVEAENDKRRMLAEMVRLFDPPYAAQYQALPDDYIARMLNGFVAFTLTVERWEARYKLSQERTATERQNVISALRASDDAMARVTADYFQATAD